MKMNLLCVVLVIQMTVDWCVGITYLQDPHDLLFISTYITPSHCWHVIFNVSVKQLGGIVNHKIILIIKTDFLLFVVVVQFRFRCKQMSRCKHASVMTFLWLFDSCSLSLHKTAWTDLTMFTKKNMKYLLSIDLSISNNCTESRD